MPSASTVGLFIMIPLAIRRGAVQTGSSSSGLSLVATQTPILPSKKSRLWFQVTQSRPAGSRQRQGSYTRTSGSSCSTTKRGPVQVVPSSSLLVITTKLPPVSVSIPVYQLT